MWFLQWVSLANTVLPTEIIICRFADEWGGVPPPHTPPVAPPLHINNVSGIVYCYFNNNIFCLLSLDVFGLCCLLGSGIFICSNNYHLTQSQTIM